MSTDGTSKPPSFAPTGTTGPQRTSVRTETRPEARTASSTVATPVEPTGPEQEVRGARPSPVVPGGHAETGSQNVTTAPRSVPPREAAPRPTASRPDRGAGDPRPADRPERDERPAAIGPRRVRLALARVDPWSVMKLAFLLSFAVGIMIVVAAAVVWTTLDSMGIFASVNQTIAEIAGTPDFFDLEAYVAFDRVIALATIIAIVDVVLLTALATLFAFLYNVVASLVGGINLTLTDD